jgi:hypothetical protein
VDYQDEDKTCRDCKRGFSFTAGEQKFFAERQFTPPVRCKQCRDTRKASAPSRQDQQPIVQRVAERYNPAPRQEERRASKYDARQEWPDAQPTKFDRYASKRRRSRHERDDDDGEW